MKKERTKKEKLAHAIKTFLRWEKYKKPYMEKDHGFIVSHIRR